MQFYLGGSKYFPKLVYSLSFNNYILKILNKGDLLLAEVVQVPILWRFNVRKLNVKCYLLNVV